MSDNKFILPIVQYNSPILRQVCTKAEDTPETQELIKGLLNTLHHIPSSAGLSAPQVNNGSQVFVMRHFRSELVVINPKITKVRGKQKSNEGCLSIPGFFEDIVRHDIINVEFLDMNFCPVKMKLRGDDSRIFQHEYDHLQGKLFIDYFTQSQKDKVTDKLLDIIENKIKTRYDRLLNDTLIKDTTNYKQKEQTTSVILGSLEMMAAGMSNMDLSALSKLTKGLPK